MLASQLDITDPDMLKTLQSYMEEFWLENKDTLQIEEKDEKTGESRNGGIQLIFGCTTPCVKEYELKVFGPYTNNRKYSKLYNAGRSLIKNYFPKWQWNQMYLHFNREVGKHKDKGSIDKLVLIISFGNYEGGELVIIDEKGEEHIFNGKNKINMVEAVKYEHYIKPIKVEGNNCKFSFCLAYNENYPPYDDNSIFYN